MSYIAGTKKSCNGNSNGYIYALVRVDKRDACVDMLSYSDDTEVFPEREEDLGSIYVEAADKVTLKKIRDITFVNAKDVLGIIYNSRSGNTKLKWRQIRRNNGKVTGEASSNSLVNLAQSGVITLDWVENYVRKKTQEN